MKTPDIIAVKAMPGHKLKLEFANQEVREFDEPPYLEKGVLVELKAQNYFEKSMRSFWFYRMAE